MRSFSSLWGTWQIFNLLFLLLLTGLRIICCYPWCFLLAALDFLPFPFILCPWMDEQPIHSRFFITNNPFSCRFWALVQVTVGHLVHCALEFVFWYWQVWTKRYVDFLFSISVICTRQLREQPLAPCESVLSQQHPQKPGGFMAMLCGSRSCRGRQRCPTAFCIALQLRLPGQPTVQGKGFRLGSLSSWLQLLKHSRCQSSVWVCSSLAIHHFFQGSWRRYRWAGSADPRTHQGFHYTRNSAISLLYTSGAMEIALIEAIN